VPTGTYKRTEYHNAISRKNGFQKGNKPWHTGTKGIIENGFQAGKEHQNWKGDEVGYQGVHIWIRKNKGTPKKCEECGTTNRKKWYEWANKDHTYKRNLEDWIRMCRGCHRKYDTRNHLLKRDKIQ